MKIMGNLTRQEKDHLLELAQNDKEDIKKYPKLSKYYDMSDGDRRAAFYLNPEELRDLLRKKKSKKGKMKRKTTKRCKCK